MARYPRFGRRLAPTALAEILGGPCPAKLLGGKISQFPRLEDLDERVWHVLSCEACRQLAEVVVQNVRWELSKLPSAVRARQLGPSGTIPSIHELDVEVRTLHCLIKLQRYHPDVAQATIGDLLEVAGCGAKTLVDLLTCLEALGSMPSSIESSDIIVPSADVIAEARRLASTDGVSLIRIDDPRLGHLIRGIDSEAHDARELAERLLRQSPHADAEGETVERLRDLLKLINEFGNLGLEAELVRFVGDNKNGRMATRYYGLDGLGGTTLQVVGDEFGVTRERVRQVVARIATGLDGKVPFAPALDSAVTFVVNRTPGRADEIESQLHDSGLTKGTFRLEGLIQAAKLLGRTPPFLVTETRGERIVHSRSVKSADKIVQIARREVSHWGIATVADIAAHIRETEPELSDMSIVASVLSGENGFQWLDRAAGWFWITSVPRNSLVNRIEKILSIANPISVSELRAGIARDYRMQGFSPPSPVLLELCRQIPTFQVADGNVRANPPIIASGVLGNVEKAMADVLAERGGVMSRTDLEAVCLQQGMNRSSSYRFLSHSPVISKYAVGVFGLIGADIAPGVVESLALKRQRGKVLADYGWAPNGQIWLAYRLSEATVLTGIVSVPAAMRAFISGEFALKTLDGASMGTLVAKESSAWGLGPFFSRRGGEAGDYLVISFDLATREASLCIGTADLVEDYANATEAGESEQPDPGPSEANGEGTRPDLMAELNRLRRENEALKSLPKSGLSMRVSEKGALSVYGLGHFPLTLYRRQWERLLAMSDQIRSFIKVNASTLKTKGEIARL